ncbi:MAG: isoleucine--tRNA ligase [Bacteroidetes bacterium]|nr:isoleucine--tRNA ligase [Bacteroidota bacterium]
MYKEFKNLNLPEIDKEVLQFWEENKIFERSIEERSADNSYVFYEGPPSANGKPGIHHVMARAIKDLVCRYNTLKGHRVERKGGWDTHGLPIELAVEKELGITKEDIGNKISVDEYNDKCRETVMQYKDLWDDITRKMGYWVDLDNPYITYENEYIESVWWLLRQLFDKGLMYKGHTIQPYSPAAGTGLSSHELNLPGSYKEVKDTSAVAQFKVIKNEKSEFLFDQADEDVRLIAWTTTPWTLPSNTGLTVGPKINYVKIKTHNPYTDLPVSVVLAEDLVSKWMLEEAPKKGPKKPVILERSELFQGSQLENIRYEQLLAFGNEIEPLKGKADAFRVILGDFVTTEDGTGIVHTAPSFGADDRVVGIKNGLGALTLVDKQGKFKDSVGPFSNRYVKNYKDDADYVDVNVDISVYLKQENKAFNIAKYEHNYPHCWRTDKPILYYPLDSWFVAASKVKDRMYELNKTINWKPASTGEGRFGKWLENLQDWNLSRSRYWGVPLPIWRTKVDEEAGEVAQQKCISSIEELQKEIDKANAALGKNQSVPKDLHRPYIDEIVLVSDNGEPMYRELDLIDVWFDSGSMPYAQWHYPFENQEKWKTNFPADFIAEGVDQTRGWFYTLHAIAVMVFDSVAFKNVVSNGMVLDKHGKKMSKRLGNAADPFETLEKYGADATRWYMIANSPPWDNLKFDLDGVLETRNKFFGTLFNTYKFFSGYANIDSFQMNEMDVTSVNKRPEIDRWVISKLYSLVKDYRTAMDDYEMTRACRLVETFVMDNLSNWYVRLCRRRFWKGEMSEDKRMAYETLFECMMVVTQLMSPVAPFFADWLYKNLTDPIREKAKANDTPLKHDSVHLSILTAEEESKIDSALEERMDYAQRISSLVLSLRKKENIRVRQPLQKIMLPVLDESFIDQVNEVKDLVLSEVNVKEIEYLTEDSGVIKKKIKANFKTLGRRLGRDMKTAVQVINGMTQDEISKIESTGKYTLTIEDRVHELTNEDFEISAEDIPGLMVANDNDLTVALDISMNDHLIAEGMARELVNRIQNIRKNSDFNVTDRIKISIEKHESIAAAVSEFGEYIKNEVLADELNLTEGSNGGEAIELPNGTSLNIAVSLN